MPECVTCGRTEHSPDAKYCKDCGTDLYYPIICKCGYSNHDEDALYCNKCGEIIRYYLHSKLEYVLGGR